MIQTARIEFLGFAFARKAVFSHQLVGFGSRRYHFRHRKLSSGHNRHLKLSRILHQMNQNDGFLNNQSPFLPSPPPPSSSGAKISPAVLFIIVILSVLFCISGLLHILVRFLTKKQPSNSESNATPEASGSDALQRQLQQLFHLHDSGLDQAFIDSLPMFSYKEIVGLQEHFDCAVCLCEFCETDQLRLLPMCSHAFHISCINTWLLSNSTCPLCRGTLFNPGFSIDNPVFEFDDFMEDYRGNGDCAVQKRVEIGEVTNKKGQFPVRLGKFRKLNGSEEDLGGESGSSSKLDERRCFSMGSYQYVVGDTNLRVAFGRSQASRCPNVVEGTDNGCNLTDNMDGKKISIHAKTDSYSVSKIWLWSKKAKFASSSEDGMENGSSPELDATWMHRTEEI